MRAVISGGQTTSALMTILNQKAESLLQEREELRAELRKTVLSGTPLKMDFKPDAFRHILADFLEVAQDAAQEELQRLIRLLVKRVEWMR